jgi:hypothetical protein
MRASKRWDHLDCGVNDKCVVTERAKQWCLVACLRVILLHLSTTRMRLPIRSIELLNVFIHHDGGLGVSCISCCGTLKTSNQSTTSPASAFDSKKNNTASIVSEKLFCQVWLTNQFALATQRDVFGCCSIASHKLPRRRALSGRTMKLQTCEVVMFSYTRRHRCLNILMPLKRIPCTNVAYNKPSKSMHSTKHQNQCIHSTLTSIGNSCEFTIAAGAGIALLACCCINKSLHSTHTL